MGDGCRRRRIIGNVIIRGADLNVFPYVPVAVIKDQIKGRHFIAARINKLGNRPITAGEGYGNPLAAFRGAGKGDLVGGLAAFINAQQGSA